jgi:hypothetical protein
MAIQFQCPGCNQPIEIDDDWASKPVACPYCRVTVTAPAESTLEPQAPPPVAKPLAAGPEWSGETSAAPAPVATQPAKGNPYAAWALGLSCLALALYVAMNIAVSVKLQEHIGASPTPEQWRQAMADMQNEWIKQMETGQVPPFLGGLLLILAGTFVAWTAGLVLTVVAFQRPARRGMAIAALVLTGIIPVFTCVGLAIGL